jgi:hypothetical protein
MELSIFQNFKRSIASVLDLVRVNQQRETFYEVLDFVTTWFQQEKTLINSIHSKLPNEALSYDNSKLNMLGNLSLPNMLKSNDNINNWTFVLKNSENQYINDHLHQLHLILIMRLGNRNIALLIKEYQQVMIRDWKFDKKLVKLLFTDFPFIWLIPWLNYVMRNDTLKVISDSR